MFAEQNAIIQAAYHGIEIKDSTLYVTLQPCILCTKILINAGIKRVVLKGKYPDEFSEAMLLEAGIQLEKFE
ncbi:deoxycytidylate deaminase [Alkaliphilus peptidifermentans]|uniref:deoxycytidylate deaminase n=1 Tax=Alkaliphilus peptidifermentans TaxID=426129 RepID=UPI000B83CEA4